MYPFGSGGWWYWSGVFMRCYPDPAFEKSPVYESGGGRVVYVSDVALHYDMMIISLGVLYIRYN